MFVVTVYDFDLNKVIDYYWCETNQEAQYQANKFVDKYPDYNRYEVSIEEKTRGLNRYNAS